MAVEHPRKPETHNGNLAALTVSAAWGPLTRERRWVCWCWELSKSGKWTKVPKRPDAPDRNASTTEPPTWGTFQQALACVTAGKVDGIGIVLTGASIGALDLDHCRDDANKSGLAGWAREICRA
jgi:primase-polymerase (primpol)-like protein